MCLFTEEVLFDCIVCVCVYCTWFSCGLIKDMILPVDPVLWNRCPWSPPLERLLYQHWFDATTPPVLWVCVLNSEAWVWGVIPGVLQGPSLLSPPTDTLDIRRRPTYRKCHIQIEAGGGVRSVSRMGSDQRRTGRRQSHWSGSGRLLFISFHARLLKWEGRPSAPLKWIMSSKQRMNKYIS